VNDNRRQYYYHGWAGLLSVLHDSCRLGSTSADTWWRPRARLMVGCATVRQVRRLESRAYLPITTNTTLRGILQLQRGLKPVTGQRQYTTRLKDSHG
jgi:hypothetical protein